MKKGAPGDDVLRALYPTEPVQEILAKLKESTGRDWSRKEIYNRGHALGVLRQVRDRVLPPSLGTPRRPITIDDDKLLLCSDSQIPYHDRQLWGQICETGRRLGIKTLVHVGDLVECSAFSIFSPLVVPVRWEDEAKTASDLLVEVSTVFSRIIILCGNHEYRLVKTLAGQLPFSEIMKGWECHDIVGDGIEVEDLPVAWLGDWGMVCHPGNYSKSSGAVAVRLAEKYQRDVFMGHDHFLALRFDISGRHKAMSLGCCCREDLMPWKQFNVTTHPVWNRGFWTVEGRKPTMHLPT